MRKEERVAFVLKEIDTLFPDAKCELHHRNAFELIIAVALSAQTTDASVNRVTPALFKRYPTPFELMNADLKEVEDYIHSIGLYRNKAKSIVNLSKALVEQYDGNVPNDKKELVKLPGVGIKTANVVVSVAFDQPAFAVDTHVERVSKRLKLAKESDNVETVERKLCKAIPKQRWSKTHHQFIFFGRYFCQARTPHCYQCPLYDICVEPKKEEYRNKHLK